MENRLKSTQYSFTSALLCRFFSSNLHLQNNSTMQAIRCAGNVHTDSHDFRSLSAQRNLKNHTNFKMKCFSFFYFRFIYLFSHVSFRWFSGTVFVCSFAFYITFAPGVYVCWCECISFSRSLTVSFHLHVFFSLFHLLSRADLKRAFWYGAFLCSLLSFVPYLLIRFGVCFSNVFAVTVCVRWGIFVFNDLICASHTAT